MPLLRLLHQLSSLRKRQNHTGVQLREQRPLKRGPEPTPSPPLLLPQRPVHHNQSVPEPFPSIVSESIQFGNRYFRPPQFPGQPTSFQLAIRQSVRRGAVGLPSCWRTIYHLLDLYYSMTAASTINKQHSVNEAANTADAATKPNCCDAKTRLHLNRKTPRLELSPSK